MDFQFIFTVFETMSSFEESVQHIKANFGKRRISTFAKKNSVANDAVEVVDDIPISELEKTFKRNNKIKTRLFKNLTAEQQQAWVAYYDDHKQLSLKVKANAPTTPAVSEHATESHSGKHASKPITEQAPIADTDAIVPAPVEKHKKRTRKAMTDNEIVNEIMQGAVNINEVHGIPTPAEKSKKRTRKPKSESA